MTGGKSFQFSGSIVNSQNNGQGGSAQIPRAEPIPFSDPEERLQVELLDYQGFDYSGEQYLVKSSARPFSEWEREAVYFGCDDDVHIRMMFMKDYLFIENTGGVVDFTREAAESITKEYFPIVLKARSNVELRWQLIRGCKLMTYAGRPLKLNLISSLGIAQVVGGSGSTYISVVSYYTVDLQLRKVSVERGIVDVRNGESSIDARLRNERYRSIDVVEIQADELQAIRASLYIVSQSQSEDVWRPQSKKGKNKETRLNQKGLGSKLCREDRVAFARSLTIEQRVALEKSPKRTRTKSREEARDAKLHKQFPFHPQSGWSIMPSFKTEHKHTIDVDAEMKEKMEELWKVLHHGPNHPIVKVAHTISLPVVDGLSEMGTFFKPLSLMAYGVSMFMNMKHKGESKFWMFASVTSGMMVGCWAPAAVKKMLDERADASHLRPEIDSGDISRLAGIIYIGMSYLTLGEVKDAKAFEKVAMKACLFDKAKSGITEVVALVVDLVERVINFIRTRFFGLDKLTIMSKDLPGLRKWCNEVESIVEISHAGELALNTETAATVFRLEREARAFETLKMSSTDAIQVRSALNSYKQALRSIVARFESASLNGNGVRMEPVATLCVGESKTGKSTRADPLLRKFINRVLDPSERPNLRKNFNDYIYGYFPENIYLDNYRQQMAVYMDDYAQAIDVPGNLDNEHMKILRMVNTVPYTCHMADIGSKGNTPFTSKIIYATSNLTRIRPNSVCKPEAIARRFALIFRCIVKEEYAINPEAPPHERKLDTQHPKLNGEEYFEDINEYEMMCVKEGGTLVPTGEKCSEDELVEKFAEIYRQRKEFFDKYTKYISTTLWEKEDAITSVLKPESGSEIQMNEMEPLESIRMNLGPVEYINECYDPEAYGLSAVDLFGIVLTSRDCTAWMRAYQLGDYPLCDEIWFEYVESGAMQEYVDRKARISAVIYRNFKKGKETLNKALSKLAENVTDKLDSLHKQYPLLFSIGSLVACAGALFGIYKMSKSLFSCFNRDESSLEPEGYNARLKGRLQAKKPKGVRSSDLKPEASRDPNSDQVGHKLLQKAMYSIAISGDEGRLGLGTFVGGRVILMPLHFIKHMNALVTEGLANESDFVVLRNEYVSNTFKIPISEFLDKKNRIDDDDQDCTFVHLKSVAHHFKNAHLFLTKAQFDKPLDLWCSLVGLDKRYHKTVYMFKPEVEKTTSKIISDFCEDYQVKQGYKYMSQVGPGDCGFMMLISNVSVGPGKIMGMHVAGSDNGAGLSCSVSKEMVEQALAKWDKVDYPPPEELNLKPQCMALPFKGDFVPICYTEKKISQPVKTKYEPSPIVGCLGPVDRFPAVLHTVNGVDPLAKAIEQYGKPKKPLDPKILKKAMSILTKRYRREWRKFRRPRNYTFEEACKGISEVEFANAVPRNTSAGYPYVMNPQPGYRGKEWYFGTDEEYDFTRPQALELKKQVEEILDKASKGERSVHVCVDTKKDELRKQSKIDNVETRLISAGALPYLIACRMVTLDFSIFVMERNLQLGVGVGINPYSEDWNMLAQKVQCKGKKVIAGDYSGFDTSCIAAVYEELVELINEFYGDGNYWAQVRRTLFADLYNSLHIYLNIIYMWLACMPSGHPLTAILNSLYNQVNLRYVWVKRQLDKQFDFDEEVSESVYGDDILLNVSDMIADVYNMKVLTEELAEMGFTFTDDLKNATSELYRGLKDVTYLKRSFRYEPLLCRYVAPLEFTSIKKSLDWVKRGPSSLEFCKSNVDNALVEFSLHKKEDFHKWASIVVEASRDKLYHEPREIERYELLKFSAKIDQWM